MMVSFVIMCFCAAVCIEVAEDARREHEKAISLIRSYEERFTYLESTLEDYKVYSDLKEYFDGKAYNETP